VRDIGVLFHCSLSGNVHLGASTMFSKVVFKWKYNNYGNRNSKLHNFGKNGNADTKATGLSWKNDTIRRAYTII